MLNLDCLKLEVTNACPLRCAHCSSGSTPDSATVVTENDCARIIDQASAYGTSTIIFSGGEPLTWEPLESMVRRVVSSGMEVIVFTSGFDINARSKLTALTAAGVTRFAISIHGSASTHDTMVGVSGARRLAEDALRVCREEGAGTEIHFTLLKTNYRELPGVIEVANKTGANQVSLLRLVPHGRGADCHGVALSRDDYRALYGMVKELRGAGSRIRTGHPLRVVFGEDEAQCMAAMDRLTVTPDLVAHPCDGFKRVGPDRIGGREGGPTSLADAALAQVWTQSPYLRAIRDRHAAKPTGTCSTCKRHAICGGGCTAQRFLVTEELNRSPDPHCFFHHC